MQKLLFDTGILVGMVRKAPWVEPVILKYPSATNIHLISIVSKAELYSLAFQFNWGTSKRQILEGILNAISFTDINNNRIIDAYAKIDAYSKGKLTSNPLPPGHGAYKMGKNDLWIAATAHVLNARLVSTDKDFDHLNNVFFDLEYITPR